MAAGDSLIYVQQIIDTYKEILEKILTDKTKLWNKGFESLEAKRNIPRLYKFLGECK